MTDVLIANVRIVPGFGPAEAPELADVFVHDGVVKRIAPAGLLNEPGPGPLSERSESKGPADRLDADGRWLIPGLWDEHVHLNTWATSLHRIDLAAAGSAAEAVAIVEREAPPGDAVVVGRDFRDALWPEPPTAARLDAAFPTRPVVLFNLDLHSCWSNTAALERFGHAGHPTGVLREHDCYELAIALERSSAADLDRWVAEAAPVASARGVVGVHDLEMGYNVEHWRRRMAAGFGAFRVDAGIYWSDIERAEREGLRTGLKLAPLLRVGSFKVITDGSLGTRNAFCVDPYPGTHDHGMLNVPPDELRVELARAQRLGLEPAVHAIGDEANRLALDAMIELGTGGRIEHAQLLRDADVGRFAVGGIEASIQPEHAMDDRDIADRYWAGRTRRGYLIRSLLDAGVRVRFGSDAPVAPLDPWQAISAAVLRSRDGREPWHPEQAISAAEALACSARTRILPGEPADLVLLDADPLGDPAVLRSMPVAATIVGGRFTYSDLGTGVL